MLWDLSEGKRLYSLDASESQLSCLPAGCAASRLRCCCVTPACTQRGGGKGGEPILRPGAAQALGLPACATARRGARACGWGGRRPPPPPPPAHTHTHTHLPLPTTGDIIHSLCFSPNRYWLCAATQGSIKIWDLE